MEAPKVARESPYSFDVEVGKTHSWCRCGYGAKQPFRDGSHKAASFGPLAHTPEKSGKALYCGCKATGNPPLGDGTRKKL